MVAEQVAALAASFREIDALREFLTNPEVESTEKSDVLVKVAAGADPLVLNFLRLIVEKGRAGELPDFADELAALVAAERHVLDVELTTAHALSERAFEQILEQIEQSSGRTVQASRKIDPDLIGGIVLQAGSMRLDASVRGRLERLRHELAQARS